VAAAPMHVAMLLPPSLLTHPEQGVSLSPLQGLVWRKQVGGFVQQGEAGIPATYQVLLPHDDVAAAPPSDEISIDSANGVLTIDTPKSAGGFANAGKSIDAAKAGVRIDGVTTDATIFVNSLDDAPIKSSKRLLVTHLTDLQNTGAQFGEGARQTLQAFGGPPHLVLDGAATVHVALDDPSAYTVWALATDGKRLEKVDAKTDGGQLTFTASVRGADGARMLYEIAR